MNSFADAVRNDDLRTARSLLATEPELAKTLNAPLPGEAFGIMAINVAARNRSTPMLDLLLEHGANINARTDWWAGSFGIMELCDPTFAPELIARGAIVDAHVAARLGDLARLTALLDADPALVHARAGDGKTPLHYASSVDIARLLLDRGADIDALDVDHESTAAQYLVSEAPDVARFLVTRGCRTDILLASALGAEELVRRTLDASPEVIRTRVNAAWFPMRDSRAGGTIYTWTLGRDKSAFIIAREKEHAGVASLLAERASPGQLFADLCVLGDREGVHQLIARYSDLPSRLLPEELALLPAAAFDASAKAVTLMLENGWPVNAMGVHGATALHCAAWHGHANLVRALLAAGADVTPRERQFDGTPLDWARARRIQQLAARDR